MIQFPNNRLTYTGQQGPVYDNDGQNAINNLYAAINMLLGLSSTGFAILSGFAVTGYVEGNNTYGSGYFYLNGVIYYSGGVIAGECLVPWNKPPVMRKLSPLSTVIMSCHRIG